MNRFWPLLWGQSKLFLGGCQSFVCVLWFVLGGTYRGVMHRNPSVFLCSSEVFPHGLPEEFTLIFTVALKKAALRDTVYLFQISDQQGYPQVQLALHFLIACLILCHITTPSLSYSLLPFAVSFSILYLFFCVPFVYSFSLCLISLLHNHLPSLSIYFLLWHRYNSPCLSFIPHIFCPLLFFVWPPPPHLPGPTLSRVLRLPVVPLSIIFCFPHSFAFIVIHVCSMMKRWSPRESP